MSMVPGRTRVILNPSAAAGRAAGRLNDVREILDHAWPGIDWCTSRSAQHLVDLCTEAASAGFARVIVAGGDGTIHLAIRGLANTATALGIIPLGTGNDFANATGIPLEPHIAARSLVAAAARAVDLGSANGVPFCCVAGVGLDTPALKFISSLPFSKRKFMYQIAAVKGLLSYCGCTLSIAWDGGKIHERMLFAAFCNTPTYAGGHRIAPKASTFDGKLDYCLFLDRPIPQRFATFLSVRSGEHQGRVGVLTGIANVIHVDAPRPVPVTLDGELTSITTPVDMRLMPAAIQLIGARGPLS